MGDIASALAAAGDKESALAILKQAMEMARKFDEIDGKAYLLRDIAWRLATEHVPSKKDEQVRIYGGHRGHSMKKTFASKEKQLAKQLVEAMQEK